MLSLTNDSNEKRCLLARGGMLNFFTDSIQTFFPLFDIFHVSRKDSMRVGVHWEGEVCKNS